MRPQRGHELLVHRVRDDSFGLGPLRRSTTVSAFSPAAHCPHYDSEDQRRPAFTRLVAAGELADGWAADDGAALVFAGAELEGVVASRPHAGPGAGRARRTTSLEPACVRALSLLRTTRK